MGIEKYEACAITNKSNKINTSEKYLPPALRKNTDIDNIEKINSLPSKSTELAENNSKSFNQNVLITQKNTGNLRSEKRERRPDRAVYVPRARRIEINNTQGSSISSCTNKTIDDKLPNPKRLAENLPNSQFSIEIEKNISTAGRLFTNSVITNSSCDNKKTLKENINQSDKSEEKADTTNINLSTNINFVKNCDSIALNPNCDNNYKLTNNIIINLNKSNKSSEGRQTMENHAIRIEDAGIRTSKNDNDIDELQRASKEINRSNRRIIKQTFKSDVLEIPENLNGNKSKVLDSTKTVDPEKDDWDSIYDENGECFDPKILEELSASVGKVKIETTKSDYSAYLIKQDILNDEEFPHVLEISNFPVEFKTQDLLMMFSMYKESGFDIKWVDDTHALAVFSSSRIAAEVLASPHPFVVLKPLGEATLESRNKARKCASSLQPYRPRPETCAALARRLVTGALGVRLKTAAEERENEKRVLKEAKERKLLAAKQREEVWES